MYEMYKLKGGFELVLSNRKTMIDKDSFDFYHVIQNIDHVCNQILLKIAEHPNHIEVLLGIHIGVIFKGEFKNYFNKVQIDGN